MKTINATTKKGGYLIERYNRVTATTLTSLYKKPSKDKIRAFNSCILLCASEKGKGFKVISANCNFFSVAWQVPEGLRVETAFNSYLVKL